MIITFVIIFTILAAFRVIVKEVPQGFFPSNSEETRRLFLPTPVCLFILYVAMAGTNEIYVTIIGDLPVLLTPV